jgi:hypothetical protein
VIGLELDETAISDGRMKSFVVVELMNVAADGSLRFGQRMPRLALGEVLFESVEEGLGDGVIPAVSFAAYALDQCPHWSRAPCRRRWHTALTVRVVHQARVRLTDNECLCERIGCGLCPHVTLQCPDRNTPLEQIDQDGKVSPVGAYAQVGDVTNPDFVRSRCSELASKQFRRDHFCVLGVRSIPTKTSARNTSNFLFTNCLADSLSVPMKALLS